MAQQPPPEFTDAPLPPGAFLDTPLNFAIVNGERVPIAAEGDDPGWQSLNLYQDLTKGAIKGSVGLMGGAGRVANQLPGIQQINDAIYGPGWADRAFQVLRQETQPQGTAESAGSMGAQVGLTLPLGRGVSQAAGWTAGRVAPYAAPYVGPTLGRLLPTMAVEGAGSAGIAELQGADPTVGAAVGAAVPVAAGLPELLERTGLRFAQSGIKPALTDIKNMAGTSWSGVEEQTKTLLRWLVNNRLFKASDATRVLRDAEQEIQAILHSAGSTPTNAPTRARDALRALLTKRSQQILPVQDQAIVQRKINELLRGPMGEDVQQVVMVPSPSGIVNAQGQAVLVPQLQTTRQLRGSMPADEALATARASSQARTQEVWGSQKGAAVEASKVTEKATRDAVKDALPDTVPWFERQKMALRAQKVLDRKEWRTQNRDIVGLPTYVMSAGLGSAAADAVTGGGRSAAAAGTGILAAGAQLLRDHQLALGIYANDLARFLQRGDVAQVATILRRFGVTAGQAEAMPPSSVPPAVSRALSDYAK